MTQLNQKLEFPLDCSRREVIDFIYQRFGKAALSKLCHVVGREDIARELLQEVFIKLWQKNPSFSQEQQVYAWIYRACHNSGIDYLRSAAFRRESFSLVPEEDQRVAKDDIIGEALSKEKVRNILRLLAPRDAEIFAYVAIDEMTHEETGEMLGVSKKTITRAIVRAREVLMANGVEHA